jgi:hypothetical protein
MYNEGFTSLKHKNYVEDKKKYGCHGNRDCYLSPYHKEKTIYRLWKAIFHEFFYYIYHLNMINSNLQHKYVYLKQICDIFIK